MNELQSLIVRGMKGTFPASDAEILREVEKGMREQRYKVFVIKYAAFCILAMPDHPLQQPQVIHFYSEIPRLRRKLVRTVLDFIKKNGYSKFQAVNSSGADDEVWKRTFLYPGWKIKPTKTVFEFEVDNG